jgi:hypothetical protein
MDELRRTIRTTDDTIDDRALDTLQSAFAEIQQPRTDYELQHFVVGQHDTDPQKYAQCVLELQIKFNAVRRALIYKRRILAEIETLKTKADDPLSTYDAELKAIDLEEQDMAMIGALREFQALYRIFKTFGKQYTRQELNGAQEEYWRLRLTRQANQDLLASGRVSVGNIDALRQIGRSPVPQLDHVRDVERRALAVGDIKVLIAVATEKKAVDGLPCLKDVEIPSGVQVKIYNVWGKQVADAYNDAARTALEDGADFLFTVEDDTFPPADALHKLLAHCRTDAVDAIGGWYPKRQATPEGAPIIIGKDGKRTALVADGAVHEVFAMPMGCTLIRTNLFLKTDFPWFATTEHLTQDTFFSQKLRDVGVRPLIDTSIRCKHVDRVTNEVFE